MDDKYLYFLVTNVLNNIVDMWCCKMLLCEGNCCNQNGYYMLGWAIVFFIISVISGIFGYTGIAVATAEIAKFIFFIFVILFVLSVLALIFIGSKIQKK